MSLFFIPAVSILPRIRRNVYPKIVIIADSFPFSLLFMGRDFKRYALERGESRSGKWSADVSGFEIKNSWNFRKVNIRRPFPAAALPSFQGWISLSYNELTFVHRLLLWMSLVHRCINLEVISAWCLRQCKAEEGSDAVASLTDDNAAMA